MQRTICRENYNEYEKKTFKTSKSDKTNRYGLGTHFFKHAEKMGINMATNMEDIMQYFNLCIITSSDKYSTEEWKDMEASWMQTLKTTQEYGGINIILERRYDQKQYQCDQCNFRTNHKNNIWRHKRMEHSDYKVLCEDCGYTTNKLCNLKRHFKAKHAKYVL